MPRAGRMALKVYDVSGACVRTLVDGWKERGTHRETWDGRSNDGEALASGIYFCRVGAGYFVAARKMVLLR